jgi:uncharacterized protein YuzE
VYIGRNCPYVDGASQSPWCNPYSVKKYGVDKCLELYEAKIRNDATLWNALDDLGGKTLGCWCVPDSRCHGEVLRRLFQEKKGDMSTSSETEAVVRTTDDSGAPNPFLSHSPNGRFELDLVHRYYADTDTLSVYFTKAAPGVIECTEVIAPGLVVDYDRDDRIVSVDFCAASKRMAIQLCESKKDVDVDGRPSVALALKWDHDPLNDELSVFLDGDVDVDEDEGRGRRRDGTLDERVVQEMTGSYTWKALHVKGASSNIRKRV